LITKEQEKKDGILSMCFYSEKEMEKIRAQGDLGPQQA
jgi:hypothetical protein